MKSLTVNPKRVSNVNVFHLNTDTYNLLTQSQLSSFKRLCQSLLAEAVTSKQASGLILSVSFGGTD